MLSAVPASPVVTIAELRSALDAYHTYHRPLSARELLEFTSRLQLPPQQWRKYVAFHPRRFCSQTIYRSRYFEINIIGWRSGQHSSVHDHRGAACCVLVLEGVLRNRDYCIVQGHELKEVSRVELGPGEILLRSGREIHRCGNEQTYGVGLATLHVYSPPLWPLSERQYRE